MRRLQNNSPFSLPGAYRLYNVIIPQGERPASPKTQSDEEFQTENGEENIEGLRNERKARGAKQLYNCQICDKVFNNSISLKQHKCRVQARFSNWPWFVCLFGQKTGINFAHFGLESGMDFEGTMGVYVSIPNEGENLKGFLRKLFVCVLT